MTPMTPAQIIKRARDRVSVRENWIPGTFFIITSNGAYSVGAAIFSGREAASVEASAFVTRAGWTGDVRWAQARTPTTHRRMLDILGRALEMAIAEEGK